MRTLGIDLAMTDTGICEINWHSRTSEVKVGRFKDDNLAERIREVLRDGGWISIDTPFGFPAAFTRSVQDWLTHGTVAPDTTDDEIRYRVSERYVAKRQAAIKGGIPKGRSTWPLSSIAALITPTVIRCARILTDVSDGEAVDRIGLTTGVVECYPISALRVWGVTTKNYKKVAADCLTVFKKLCRDAAISRPALDGIIEKRYNDAVDAFVCALVARMVALADDGKTGPEQAAADGDIDAAELDTVREEGWIHLPPPDHRLDALAPS